MRINTLDGFRGWILLVFLCAGFSPLQASDEPVGVKVILERVERVSRDEAHFSVKMKNESSRPIFLAGINFERPIPELLFLEQWRTEEGWRTVTPRMDPEPPHVIKLKPNGAITLDLVLNVHQLGVCKERNVQLKGRFQFRLNYFSSAKQVRAYLGKIFSSDWQSAHSAVAVSEPFEIPMASEP